MNIFNMKRQVSDRRPFTFRSIAIFSLRLVLGGMFVYASLHKIAGTAQFSEVVSSYEIIPFWMVNITAIFLPWFELLIGILLVGGVFVRSCASLQMILLFIFIIAIEINITRKIDIDCGCFAGDSLLSGMNHLHILTNAVFLFLSIVLFSLERRRFSHRIRVPRIFRSNQWGRHLMVLVSLTACLYCFITDDAMAAQSNIMKTGDSVPDIKLKEPLTADEMIYLGFDDKKKSSLRNISADFVWIEIFSIYCPVCQAQASKLGRLYELVNNDSHIRKKLKMLGIGAGNNSNEVSYFKSYYKVPFPLISDPEFKLHKAFKETRTPVILIVDKRSKPYKVIAVLDFQKDPEGLIEDIRARLAVK